MPRPGNLTDATFPELEQLVRAAEALESLSQHPGWELLTELLGAERQAELRSVGGRDVAHTAYAHAHGRVSGLEAPEGIVTAVITRAAERRAEVERQDTIHAGAGRR